MKLKQIIAKITSVAVVMGMVSIPALAETEIWDGKGDTSWYTSAPDEKSYTLTTAAQFAGLASLVSGGQSTFENVTITLDADLDFDNREMQPIGYVSGATVRIFKGAFDGNGHVINNIHITNSKNSEEVGLFARLEGTGTIISNLGLENITVSGDGTSKKANFVGGLVAHARNITISGCYVKDMTLKDVANPSSSTAARCGALVGQARTGLTMTNCYAVDFKTDESVASNALIAALGPIVHSNASGNYSISNCYAGGYKRADGYSYIIGAIGSERDITVENVYYDTYQNVSGTWASKVYGTYTDDLRNKEISGFANIKTLDVNDGYPIHERDYEDYKAQKSEAAAPESINANVNGSKITIEEIEGGEYSLDLKNWQSSNVFSGMNDGAYTIYARYSATDTAYSSLPVSTTVEVLSLETNWYDNRTYEISTPSQLNSMSYINSDFSGITIRLTEDIDVSSVNIKPIEVFNGTFDGQGHTISNISLATDGDNAAFINTLAADGIVKNIGFNGVTITGDTQKDESNAAAIVAVNNGVIEYCYVRDFKYSGMTWRVAPVAAYTEGNINHCYVINLDLSGAYNSKWMDVCEGIGMCVGRVESGTVSNCYVGGKLTGAPGYRFDFGYTVDGNSSNFKNCYSSQYRQGGVLNPNNKMDGNYTYPIGVNLSGEQLKTMKKGWCKLEGFAIDYYDINEGYPIFETDVPVCYISEDTDITSVIPNGGKIIASSDAIINVDTDKHYIINGGHISGSIKADSIEITGGAVVEADISANNVVLGNAEIVGSITGSNELDMTDYTGYTEALNSISGFETVYGPETIKIDNTGIIYVAQYDNGRLNSLAVKKINKGESYSLSNIDTTISSPVNSKIFIWDTNQSPIINSYKLRDKISRSQPLKVLVLGNSITWHSEYPAIGWYGARGMASSSDETDYVHILEGMFANDLNNAEVKAVNIAALENYWNIDSDYLENYYYYKELKAWKPDVIIITIGANMLNSVSDATTDQLESAYRKAINIFADRNSDLKVITGTTVLTDASVIEAINNVAVADGYKFVDCKTGITSSDYLATNYENPAVASHPNDAGMAEIAKRLYDAYLSIK